LGSIEPEPGGAAESLTILREAIALMEPIANANPKSANIAVQLATTREYAGHRLESLYRDAEAADQYQASLAAAEAFLSSGNASAAIQAIADEEALALLCASQGDRARSTDLALRAVAHAEKYAAGPRSDLAKAHLARSYFVLASVYSRFADWAEARRLAKAAIDLWQPIRSQGILAMHRQAIADASALVETFPRP
jgi:tetratricopeptide (TPR) repeat protein